MCARNGKVPALECTLGDCVAGTEIHMPDGERWMVLGMDRTDTDTMMVNLGNAGGGYNPYGRQGDELRGRVSPMRSDVKLGRDEAGRLYASTALNDWYLYADDLPAKTALDAACEAIGINPPAVQREATYEDGCPSEDYDGGAGLIP